MSLSTLFNSIAGGVFAGTVFWLLLWPLSRVRQLWRFKPMFADGVLNGCAEHSRAVLRAAERDLLLLTGAACAALAAFLALLTLGNAAALGVLTYVLFGIACALFVAWCVFIVRGLRCWRRRRFEARADAAIGATLARLAMQGYRVFHAVPLGRTIFEHVVVGPHGLFVVKVVARRVAKPTRVVRLNGRTLEFQDGTVLTEPVVSAENGARVLAELVGRMLDHRIQVRAVLAVPGWEVAPVPDGGSLLVNEKNALMLPGWSRPADHVFEDDLPALQERFARLCVNRTL